MTSVTVVTGCDSGLGREFAGQYLAEGRRVVATCLDLANAPPPAPGLTSLKLDVTAQADVDALAAHLGDTPVSLLVSNAGLKSDGRGAESPDLSYAARLMEVNALGPLRLASALLPALKRAGRSKIALVSSRMGSIEANLTGGHVAYRASKAALNAIGRTMALEYHRHGVTLVTLHPGWVRTDNGGEAAPLSAEESVAGMRKVIAALGSNETGGFYSHTGQPLPW